MEIKVTSTAVYEIIKEPMNLNENQYKIITRNLSIHPKLVSRSKVLRLYNLTLSS